MENYNFLPLVYTSVAIPFATNTTDSAAIAPANFAHLQASFTIFFTVYAVGAIYTTDAIYTFDAGDSAYAITSGSAILPSATNTTANWKTSHILAEGALPRVPPRLA
jgi:hypothetical protein